MVLKLVKTLALPNHPSGGFDHGDVVEVNGLSVVAHTGNGTVEVYNGRKGVHIKTIPDMPGRVVSSVVRTRNWLSLLQGARGGYLCWTGLLVRQSGRCRWV